MNRVKGNISNIQNEGALSIVDIKSNSILLKAILIDGVESYPKLKVGADIAVLFKETEVIIGVGNVDGISLRNKLFGTVQSINSGKLLCSLAIKTELGIINSVITKNAVDNLKLDVGSECCAMVKTNEIMLELL